MALGTKRKASNILSKQPLDLPPGTIHAFAGTTAPEGWMICDGTAISRTDYAGLFAAIGELWGNGDGSTTFNLPDLEGRFLRGADNSSGIDPDAGSRIPLGNGVAEGVGSLQNDQYKSHNHRQNALNSSSGSQNLTVRDSSSSGNNTTDTFTQNSGGNETRPSNCSVNYIIKL
jgi:microcystin-dependent protein